MTRELRALTAARGIAAWWVVLYHIRLSIAGLPDWAEAALTKGYLAVDFFFLLSGFVIGLTWQARMRESPASIGTFLWKRVARIWPLHVAMLGVAVALATLLALTGRPVPPQFDPAQLPLHLLLVQNWGFTDALAWNDPAWSISAEWGAYLLFPLLALGIDWRGVPSWAIGAALAAALLLLASIYAAAGHALLGADIPRLGLVRCVIEFGCGTALAALWRRWEMRSGIGIACLSIGAGGLLLPLPETLRIPAAFACLLLGLAILSERLEIRVLHRLGEVSYATYLSHFLLWYAFKLALVRDADAVSPTLIALYLALVLGTSFALYHWVELPAQRALLRLQPRTLSTRSG